MTYPIVHRHRVSDVAERIADLKRKADARRGNPAFRENVKAIEAEIARLEQ